ncbi:MAG TPA: chemotaxis response regulator protein-glutamate methylesterase [Candidatus Acidoferrales bacterium]|nr:chemotaxis response regulator protein-glutamate methylesterase [Candidatus Acidoferrales bacterium]
MPPIRILIVDDSAVIRRVLTDSLASDAAVEVVGTAANGEIALGKIPQLTPDLITLDVEMPGMNGLETIRGIRKNYPKLPIIMFSTLTERGASTTLDALALGATDYVTKPSNTGSLAVTTERIRQELLPKIKALCPRDAPSRTPAATTVVATTAVAAFKAPQKAKTFAAVAANTGPVEILAIGTSTGGPNALAEVLPALPRNFPVPIVIVQHMPPLFTRLLAERLTKQASIPVREGAPGTRLDAGQAWIAPGDYHMTVEKQGTAAYLATNQNPPENSCRPAVDPLFRSVAKAFGANVLAVVLTGMGSDGVVGSQHIREHGGQVYIQDEASSVVWGMPGQVAAAGLANAVYPLQSIGQEIVRRVMKAQAPPRNTAMQAFAGPASEKREST